MASNHNEHGSHHHITPFSIYVKVALALYVFTVLTVVAHYFEHTLGVFAAPVALLIATIKAILVMLFFMGLKYENNQNRVIFSMGFFFLVLLYFFSVFDIYTRITQSSSL
jgi:cytochrome c oxidase subunit 4